MEKVPLKDKTYFYSDLAMMPKDSKLSAMWAAQMLFFQKRNGNSVPLVDPIKAVEYRKNTNLKSNEALYKRMIDPITPKGGGGQANYTSTDWSDLPIQKHLRDIRKAKLQKIGIVNQVQVNEINKFSKSQRQRAKDKIIHQQNFRKLISIIAEELNLPPLSKSETAEEYISKLEGKDSGKISDDVSRIMEQIQLQIEDDKDYALYEKYVYKGEIERAFELYIQHYIINQNKWKTKSLYFIEDIENFNAFCGKVYIDKLTGRQEIEYLDPATLRTSPFTAKDGEDIIYWFYEKEITFADFIRQFGTTLDDDQLKDVFELNKATGAIHNLDWDKCSSQTRNNAMIRIGFSSVLTQEIEKFAEVYTENSTPIYKKMVNEFVEDTESAEEKQKAYNVWYSFYFIPPTNARINDNSLADWQWQSKYIFNIEKDVDMYRYGVDRRYAKSSLVLWKSNELSCTDVENSIMPQIGILWQKYKSAIANDFRDIGLDQDFFLSILNAVDEGGTLNSRSGEPNTSGVEAGLETFRQMKQSGTVLLNVRDKNGNPIPNLNLSELFIDNKQLDKAEKYMQLILQQYELLKIALAQSDVTEGQTGRPRTTVTAIEAAIESSNNAQWFVEYPVRECLIMFGERAVQHLICIIRDKVKYKDTKRWDSITEVIGLSNALMLEGVVDIPLEDIGLTVSLEDTQQVKDYIFQLANEMVKTKEISFDALGVVIDSNRFNWKYAFAILNLAKKQQEKENAAQQQLQFEQQKELENIRLQTALALVGGKSQARQQEIGAQAQADAQIAQMTNELKHQSQSDLKQQTTQNRILENDEKEKSKANAEVQKALI